MGRLKTLERRSLLHTRTVGRNGRNLPDDGELKAELKGHERYTDLHSQSSQRVLEELAEAFNGWFSKRRNGDNRARPPGYRKNGDSHPRSTVSFKAAGFKHDAQFTRVRLSKGRNLKEHRSDFILCEYQTRPDVDLTEWDIQQVRAVYKARRVAATIRLSHHYRPGTTRRGSGWC